MFVLRTRNGVLDTEDRVQLDQLREALSAADKKVHLHLHGGLIDEAAGFEIAKKLADKTSGMDLDGWERVFVVWRTGAIETLKINWSDLFENDRLYKTILRRLLKFVSDRIGQNDATGRSLGGGLNLTKDNINSRLAGRTTGNPFADVDEISLAGTPAGRSISSAADDATVGDDFAKDLKKDETIQAIATDVASALTRSPVSGRSALAAGNPAEGAFVLKNLDRSVVKEFKNDVPADQGAREFFSSATIVTYIAKHGKNIAVNVFKRFRSGRHHGLYATVIEEIIRELYGDLIGASIWGMMKRDAADHFTPGRLGGELMSLFEESHPKTVLVTAHSAGSIWATEMLDYLEERSSTLRVKVVFLAPAVRTDRFGPVISKASEFIEDFRMFTMPDHLERKDPVLGANCGYLYPSSLLYLVSGLFEDRDAAAFVDAPILGMARFLAADFPKFSDERDVSAAAAAKSFLDHPDRLVMATENSNEGFKCNALSHGGFDDDPETLASIAYFVRVAVANWAIVVGINEYNELPPEYQLHGAVEDAADFTEWVLHQHGGQVPSEHFYYWTFPPKNAPPSMAWKRKGTPDPTRAPAVADIVALYEKICSQAGDLAGPHRIFVFFAGHGVQVDGSNNQAETCFVVGDYEGIGNLGIVPCDRLRIAFQTNGFAEVIMFLDCCRTQLNFRSEVPNIFAYGADGMLRHGVGRAASQGSRAFEFPDTPPKRGAFTQALMEGLRQKRDETGNLTLNALEEYVYGRVPGLIGQNKQFPQFDFDPRNPPFVLLNGPVISRTSWITVSNVPAQAIGQLYDSQNNPVGPQVVEAGGVLRFSAPVGHLYSVTVQGSPTPLDFRHDSTGERMSPSAKPRKRSTEVIIHGPPGVLIDLFDGASTSLGRVTERLRTRLSPGLYSVRWSAYDLFEERVVRVVASSETQHVHPTKKDLAPPRVGSALSADELSRPSRSQIAVVVLSADEGRDSELSEQIRLFSQSDSAIRSNATAVNAVQDQLGSQPTAEGGWWALKAYNTKPGQYRLRYRSHKGDAIDQIVPALPGRQTVVILRKHTAQMLIPAGKAYKSVGFFGADPEAVTVFTNRARNPLEGDQLRVTRLLLSYLRNGGPFPDKNLLRRVRSNNTDPLQRLYAAAVIVAGLNRPGDLSGRQEHGNLGKIPEERAALIEEWAPVAERLVASLPQEMPDVFALNCRIAALRGVRPQDAKLSSPPMLAYSWTWIAEQDVLYGNTIPKEIVFHAATEGRIPAEPWLAWLSAAAKFGTAQKQDHRAEDSDTGSGALSRDWRPCWHFPSAACRPLRYPNPHWRYLEQLPRLVLSKKT